MKANAFVFVVVLAAVGLKSNGQSSGIEHMKPHYMRVARIVVDSVHLAEYYAALREGIRAAVRDEPGVLNLWAVAEKTRPTHITVFEIYADEKAYAFHVQTKHFKKYKSMVQGMVVSLELVDVEAIGLESKGNH